MEVHLVDGTYELFRQYLAPRPGHRDPDGIEVAGVRGVVQSILGMIEAGATHVGVATDHTVESFRNGLWAGYKTGEGIDPELFGQFPLLESALTALGVAVWPMIEHEADDGLASAAAIAASDRRVSRILVCTPDKDLAQCVGGKVVMFDRRRDLILDTDAVVAKYGVVPAAIPDWLALVGDTADGFPGLPGFGAKTAAALLGVFGTLEAIPDDPAAWSVPGVRGATRLAAVFAEHREDAALFKVLATLRTDAPVGRPDDWEWKGPGPEFAAWCTRLGSPGLADRAERAARKRGVR